MVGTDATIQDFAQRLIRAVWPDHPPIHVEVADRPDSDAGGFCGPWIGDLFTGRPVRCILINTARLPDDPTERPRVLAAVVVHELAHAIADGPPESIPSEHRQDAADVLETAFVNPRGDPGALPWAGHEADFVRGLIHLLCRAERAGYAPDVLRALPFYQYGISGADSYFDTLRSEIESHADEPIESILKTDPPERFTMLWDADVRSYHEYAARQRAGKGEETMSVFDTLRRRKTERIEGFTALAALIASGEHVPLTDIEAALVKAGKTPDDLEQAVTAARHRIELRAKVNSADKVGKEIADAEKRLAAATEKLERAQQEYDDTAQPLHYRLTELRSQRIAANNARTELREHPHDATLAARLAEARQRKGELCNARYKLTGEIEDAARTAEFHDERARREHGSALTLNPLDGANQSVVTISNSIEQRDHYRRVAGDRRATLASVEAELAELEKLESTLLSEAERS